MLRTKTTIFTAEMLKNSTPQVPQNCEYILIQIHLKPERDAPCYYRRLFNYNMQSRRGVKAHLKNNCVKA